MARNNDDFQKAIVMSIQQAEMTAHTLRNMLREFLQNSKQYHEGQTTVAKLAENRQLDEVKISETNIADFQKTAQKFNLSYALKCDNATVPPTYFVFFQNDSKSKDAFNRAFTEFVEDKEKEPVLRAADIENVGVVREKKQAENTQTQEQNVDLWANMPDTQSFDDTGR